MTKLRRPEQQDILQARHPFRNENVFSAFEEGTHILKKLF